MVHEFQFYFPQAKRVSVIGDFNDWFGDQNPMERDGRGIWRTKIELGPGEYHYRYLIDNSFELNDPLTNLYLPAGGGRLASLLVIDRAGKHVVNSKKYRLHLKNYGLTNELCEKLFYTKRDFSLFDEQIIAYFEFTRIEGLHTLTLLWYKPDGSFYHWDEGILWQEGNDPVKLWFWLNLCAQMPTGNWNLGIYLNGARILEDKFRLKPMTYNSAQQDGLRKVLLADF